MKLNHIIRKVFLTSLGLTLTLYSSFGSGILSSSLLRRTSPHTPAYIAQKAVVNAVRFCSTIPEGFDIIEFNRKHKAPWLDKKQTKKEEEFLDISQFCADPERGILYRYQSSGNSEDKKETFPLFKTRISTFDRCSGQSDCRDVFNAMGLVESFFDLGDDKSIVTAGTGFLIDSDTVLTAGHNLTLDPKDSTKITIKTPLKANKVKFFLRYDEGMSGGPILVRGLPIALGVHTRGCLDLNRGVHHFEHMVSYLKKWFSEKDGQQESSSEEIINMISELAKTEEEKTHLMSSLDKIKDFQQENLRPYLAAILHVYRK